MPPENEHSLALRFCAGDEVAFEEIITSHKNQLFSFILRYVNDQQEAENLLSETFVRAWKRRGHYQPKAKMQTWLYTIATNLCRDHARKQRRHPADFAAKWTEPRKDSVEASLLDETQLNPRDTSIQNEQIQCLERAIYALPHKLKTVLVLCALEGLSHEEAATRIGCTSKAVETRLYRARQVLRKSLKSASN